jgi:hypothetical protein
VERFDTSRDSQSYIRIETEVKIKILVL